VSGLGRFDHHPDPATDFCVEVEAIEGALYERKVGFDLHPGLDERIRQALTFRVGGDMWAVRAKTLLRALAQQYGVTS
jgi:hypothetical protein